MLPSVGVSRRAISRAVVDFPQPVSPTIPSVSPRRTSNEMPSTARTAPICFWKRIPCVIGKCLTRSRTSTSASPFRLAVATSAGPRLDRQVPLDLGGHGALAQLLPDPLARLGREEAAHEVVVLAGGPLELRMLRGGLVGLVEAARVKTAAGRGRDQAGRPSRD